MPLSTRIPDLAALDLLLSVIELGSLGRAAQAHGISQPSASSRIQQLERLVGVPVLERSARGSRPSPTGKLIAAGAKEVVDAARRLETTAAALRSQRGSHLQVAASQTVSDHLFPTWLGALQERRPDTTVTLMACNSREAGEAVLAGHADIGFVEGPKDAPEFDTHVVARDRLVTVVAPQHPWARRTAITVTELAEASLIQRETGSGARAVFESALVTRVPAWQPRVLLALSSNTAIKNAVASGAGTAILSSLAVHRELAAGSLTAVTVQGFEPSRSLRAVWPTGQRLVGAARELYTIACRSTPRP
ncbi:LysR family transcriptional regulator [Streptomyces sp. AN091965]|uniref:LysR family transcriptional regulator n=1 Tax=Streptomyces sp. AN091965 TaxID=2927803 RepID=UPI001F60DDBF|nr:LysR family transcriptional regulator [Streptomyces sp. AN091965]MCI3927806.1 LysR family transcriptional regulator [Streptomyces sp. AN091965]